MKAMLATAKKKGEAQMTRMNVPTRVCNGVPVTRSQTIAVSSRLPETRRVSSGLKEIWRTKSCENPTEGCEGCVASCCLKKALKKQMNQHPNHKNTIQTALDVYSYLVTAQNQLRFPGFRVPDANSHVVAGRGEQWQGIRKPNAPHQFLMPTKFVEDLSAAIKREKMTP